MRTRIIATLLLLCHLLVGARVLPALVCLAAEMEGTHEVRVRFDAQRLSVVLHHPTAPTLAAEEHESPLGQVLASLTELTPEMDHLLAVHLVQTESATQDARTKFGDGAPAPAPWVKTSWSHKLQAMGRSTKEEVPAIEPQRDAKPHTLRQLATVQLLV
jgi:hypothetical protein